MRASDVEDTTAVHISMERVSPGPDTHLSAFRNNPGINLADPGTVV